MSATERAARRPVLRVRIILLGMLLAALVAHLAFWYMPRVHAAKPVAGGAAAALLGAPGYDIAIWLPYPHQNLAALEKRTGDLDDLAASIARLGGSPPPVWPHLGPFRFPPAREMAWASSADGEHWQAVVRLYPSVAWLLRTAGRLAGNPWLHGGFVTSGGGRLKVSWSGSTWHLARDPLPFGPSGPRRASSSPTVAGNSGDLYVGLVRLGQAHGLLPAGTYHIRRLAGALQVTMGRPPADAMRSLQILDFDGSILTALYRGPAGRVALVDVLAVLAPEPGATLTLPSAVLVSRGGADVLHLPGEESLRRVGVRPEERRVGSWTIRGWDESSLRFGRGIIPQAERWVASGDREVTLVRVDLAATGRWAAGVGAELRRLPLLGKGMARTWLDAARVAAACGPRAQLLAAVDAGTPGVEIRLEPGKASPVRH
jgi:hypothetical protein